MKKSELIKLIEEQVREVLREGKLTKKDSNKVMKALKGKFSLHDVRVSEKQPNYLIANYTNYTNRSKLGRAIMELGWEYVNDGRDTNSEFGYNWIAFKKGVNESVNEASFKDDKYWADYSDIGQFSVPRSKWKSYTDEQFYKMGKDIVKKKYKGNIKKAYDATIRKTNWAHLESVNEGLMDKELKTAYTNIFKGSRKELHALKKKVSSLMHKEDDKVIFALKKELHGSDDPLNAIIVSSM